MESQLTPTTARGTGLADAELGWARWAPPVTALAIATRVELQRGCRCRINLRPERSARTTWPERARMSGSNQSNEDDGHRKRRAINDDETSSTVVRCRVLACLRGMGNWNTPPCRFCHVGSRFSVTAIRSDGFSWSAIGTGVGAAVVWSLIGLIGTCYFSIPIATLLTGGVSIASHQFGRWRKTVRRPTNAPLR